MFVKGGRDGVASRSPTGHPTFYMKILNTPFISSALVLSDKVVVSMSDSLL